MGQILRAAAFGAAAVAVLTTVPSSAAPAHRTRLTLTFSSRDVSSSTGLHVTMAFTDPSNPSGKAPRLVTAVLTLPQGTMLRTDSAPRCTASDADLTVRGTAACPDDTRVGSGTIQGDTGVGAPVDPITGDDTVFNGPDEIIEVVTPPGMPFAVAVDRLHQRRGTVTAHPPAPPGGPPDGHTTIRRVDFTIPARGAGRSAYITTPGTCPPSGVWTTTGRFTFADGVSDTVLTTTPCRRRR